MPFINHEDYFANVPADVHERLLQIQAEIEARIPGAKRCIGYNMPGFRFQRNFFYFAAFKNHIGIYPPLHADSALIEASARWRGPKGNLSFLHQEPLPITLIGDIAVALALQYQQS